MPSLPNITQGQMALDPVNQIIYYKTENGTLKGVTLKWLQETNTEIDTTDTVNVGGDFVITGNLTVNGTTTTLNTESILVEDNILVLNSNVTASPSTNAGIEIERGTSQNVVIRWNEGVDRWEFTDTNPSTGPWYPLVKTADDLSEGTTNLFFTDERAQDAINTALVAGTGVSKSYNDGLNTITVSIGQPVGITDTVTFNHVNANVTGQISDISNHGISDLSDVTITSPANGDFLRYSGSAWINDPVNLTTDTVGDYVAKLAAGTGITITNNSGEGATPNIAFSGSIDNVSDVVITAAANGQTLIYDGTNWVNTTFPSSEPIGHENKSDSVISFDEGSRQFSISPASSSYTVWCKGKRYVKTSTESVTIPDTSGLYYIYFNSSGSLAYKTTYFTWEEDTPTAYIYWNDVDNKAYFFADERHGVTLDWATHEYLHRTRGAAIASGFGVNNYTTTGDGSSDAHCQLDIANGTFFDEDLQVDIEHSATPTSDTWQQRIQSGAYIPVFYRSGSVWKKDVATQFPVKQGAARAQYNVYSGGTWSTVDINNNQFGISWIVATNNLNEPIIAILGQTQETNVGNAQAIDFSSLDLSGFPVFEFRPLYKFIYDTSNTYSNTPHTVLKSLIDIRQVISGGTGISAVAISDHGNLTGLQDDDHTQYFNSARHDAHDHSTALNSAALNDLGDVTITSVATNQGLIWNGSAWVNSTIPLNLDGLSDVIITAATPNQVLKFDGTNWINDESPSGLLGTTYTTTIGDGINSTFVINHSLSTREVVVATREVAAPYSSFITSWDATTLNTVTLYFENPPSAGSVQVNIYAAVSGSQYTGASYVSLIGDGTTENITISHLLNTRNVFVQFMDAQAPYAQIDVNWEAVTDNSITAYFETAPAYNSVKALVFGSVSGPIVNQPVNAYATTIGDGSNLAYVVSHNLGSRDIILQARNANSPYENYNIAWEATTINTATVYFDSAPASNSVRIKVIV